MASRLHQHDGAKSTSAADAYLTKGSDGGLEVYEMKSRGEEVSVVEDESNDVYGRTTADRQDMYRMNKVQELRRNFRQSAPYVSWD